MNINLFDELQKLQEPHQSSSSSAAPTATATSPLRLLREVNIESQHQYQQSISPILIGSVGCQADCEQLKRMMRSELRTALYFGEITIDNSSNARHHHNNNNNDFIITTNSISIETIAVLLSQILYYRRTFPFGCYCILGGMSYDGMGQVYVYDAIGSYEQLAIACTGTGFELLQPILDRQFNSLIPSSSLSSSSARATSSLQYSKNIRRPSSLQVDCPTVEEAIRILTKAYRSVSEREIGVGDHVVFYSIQRIQEKMNDGDVKNDTSDLNGPQSTGGTPNVQSPKMIYQSKIWTAPLKKH